LKRPPKILSIKAARKAERQRTILLAASGVACGVLLGLLAINIGPFLPSAVDLLTATARNAKAEVTERHEQKIPFVDVNLPQTERFLPPDKRFAPISIRVIDGDTIRLNGRRPNVRLVGFNTPETRRPRCPAEAALGAQATRRLRELVREGNLDFTRVACACAPGTEGTDACNFGRACGRLKSSGRDVGDILISERLAVPFHCGATSCPPMPRPWC
jgi:endonuclease YncB( thermonuclease family)